MNMLKLAEQRRSIFKGMEQEFVDELVPASYSDGDEEHAGVLTVFLEDIAAQGLESSAEFFFLPVNEEETGMQIFINLFTLIEEVTEENMTELMLAISMLNAYIPLGAYALDPAEGCLVYKYAKVMPADITKEELHTGMELSMGAAMQTVERFSYLLVEVNDGERNAKSVSDLMTSGQLFEE